MSFIRESETRTYLVCSRWRKNAGLGICTSHCIRESLVEDIVRSALRKSAESVSASEILSSVRISLDNNHSERLLAEQLKHKLNICAQTLLSLYKDKASGAVSQEEYAELSAAVHTERAAYLRQLDELNAAVCQPSPDSLSESLKALVSFEHPDRSTLLLLIDKIYIGKSKEIELHFKFCNPL